MKRLPVIAGSLFFLDFDLAFELREFAMRVVILLAGVDPGLQVPLPSAVTTMLACAEAFLAMRTSEWRLAELDSGPERIAHQLGADADPGAPATASRPPLGLIPQPEGMVAVL